MAVTIKPKQKRHTLTEVMARTGITRTTLFRYIKEGKFPAPAGKIDKANYWEDSQIDDWMNEHPEGLRYKHAA